MHTYMHALSHTYTHTTSIMHESMQTFSLPLFLAFARLFLPLSYTLSRPAPSNSHPEPASLNTRCRNLLASEATKGQ